MAKSKFSLYAATEPSPPPVFDSDSEPVPGRVLAQRYQLIKRLGSGGMGVVFHAKDLELHEDIALKVLMPDWNADEETAERFRNEVRLARKIVHPGVCRVFDMGEDGALRFLTMELIEGRTLKELMRAEKCSARQGFLYLHKIADGLSAVHERGIVHRDLKPENILVRPDGQAVLVDFGLARDSFLPNRSSSRIAGTPQYMSPEQLRGERLDARSDVFSFGVMAFELFTGRSPFGNGVALDVATAILRDVPLRFEAEGMPEGAEEAFQAFFERALAKAPDKRFGSAGELGRALEEAWAGRSLRPVTKTPLPEVKKKRGWGRKVAWLGLVGAMGLGAMLGLTRERWKTARWMEDKVVEPLEKIKDPRPLVEVRAFKNLSRDPKWDALAEGAGEEAEAGLRTLPRIQIVKPIDLSEKYSPTWIIAGNVRSFGDQVRLTIEIKEPKGSTTTIPPIEIDSPPNQSTRLLKRGRTAILEDIISLVERRKRNKRAIEGTQNPKAQDKLLSFYEVIDKKPKEEELRVGMKLLDEALAFDPDYVPALTERADLLSDGIGVTDRVDGIKKSLEDLTHALAIDPTAREAHIMNCLVRRVSTEILGPPSDSAINEAEASCLAALEVDPKSARVRLAFARLYDKLCEDERALKSLEQIPKLDPTLTASALVHIIHTALQNDLLQLAEHASAELIEFEESKRSGIGASRGIYLMRGAVLMRLSEADSRYLLPAKEAFENEIGRAEAYASPYQKWYEAGAIRGLMRIANREGANIKPEYKRRLAYLEQQARSDIFTDPSTANNIAVAYQWTDPEVGIQWLNRRGSPKTFEDAFRRAQLYFQGDQIRQAGYMLRRFEAIRKWEKSCARWLDQRIAAH